MKKSKIENILSKSIESEKQNRLKEFFKRFTIKEKSSWFRNICISLLVFLVILSSLFIYIYFISKQESEIKNDTSFESTSE